MSNSDRLVNKLWSYCNVLRDDGLSYQDYLEQLTFLLCLKMADEWVKLMGGEHPVPKGYRWGDLSAPSMEGVKLDQEAVAAGQPADTAPFIEAPLLFVEPYAVSHFEENVAPGPRLPILRRGKPEIGAGESLLCHESHKTRMDDGLNWRVPVVDGQQHRVGARRQSTQQDASDDARLDFWRGVGGRRSQDRCGLW